VGRDAGVDLPLLVLKLELGRMLELLQLNDGATKDIDSLHKALHTLPHVGDRLLDLLL